MLIKNKGSKKWYGSLIYSIAGTYKSHAVKYSDKLEQRNKTKQALALAS